MEGGDMCVLRAVVPLLVRFCRFEDDRGKAYQTVWSRK